MFWLIFNANTNSALLRIWECVYCAFLWRLIYILQWCSQGQNLKAKAKAWTFKAKAKAWTFKAKAKAWGSEAKAEAWKFGLEAKARPRPWVQGRTKATVFFKSLIRPSAKVNH